MMQKPLISQTFFSALSSGKKIVGANKNKNSDKNVRVVLYSDFSLAKKFNFKLL
jgi:uncharacterized protein YrrD